jgi:hypothetical protein
VGEQAGAFALSQFGVLGQASYPYLALNAIGSGSLAILAVVSQQWGFLLLEGGWALVSLWGIVARASGRKPKSVR